MRVKDGKISFQKSRLIEWKEPEKELDDYELEVADLIAEELRLGYDEPGLVIWKRCKEYGVNQTKIARHLQGRAKKKRK